MLDYTIIQNVNYIFASVYANWTGYNVSIIEVDHLNNEGKFLLHSSVDSDTLSAEGIVDVIRPIIPSEVTYTRFLGVYFNRIDGRINDVAGDVWKTLGCKGNCFAPPRSIEASLCDISLKINSGQILVAPELVGVIHADIQRTKPDDIPYRIQSLIQMSGYWNRFKNGMPQEKSLTIEQLYNRGY